MNPERAADLWGRLLGGNALSPSEEQELADALSADAELRSQLLENEEFDGLLGALGRADREAEAFMAAFGRHLAAERSESGFIRKLEHRIKEEEVPREKRPPTRRRHRHPSRTRGPSLAIFVASAVLLGLIGIVVLLSSGGAKTPPEARLGKDRRAEEQSLRKERLEAIAREERELSQAKPADVAKPVELQEEERRRKLDRLAEERRRIEEEMRRAVDEARKNQPQETEPRRSPVPPPRQEPEAPPPRPATTETTTRVAVATLGYVEGDVVLVALGKKTAAKTGEPILAGDGLEVAGRGGVAVVRYADGTRLELREGTAIEAILGGAGGKRLSLIRGALHPDVAKQPPHEPMVILTPHAEVKVLGTTLRIVVDLTGTGSTRLDVDEGKVRLTRTSDGKAADVTSGHYAVAATGLEMTPKPMARVPLPFDRTCPVIYTNNSNQDCYTDEYLMALASAGDIRLRGIIVCTMDALDQTAADRAALVAKARRSGMRNIPDPVLGPGKPFVKPPSGKIEETRPWGSPAGRLIVAEARKATPRKPLVVVSGGPPAAVADAYLLDPSIADRVVVASHEGRTENDVMDVDPWGVYVVLERFRVVLFGPVTQTAAASVPQARSAKLPEGELRQAMIEKGQPTDANGMGAIAVLRADYCLRARRKSVVGWLPDGALGLTDDANGRLLVITEADQAVATEEFWRALEKPAAWGQPR